MPLNVLKKATIETMGVTPRRDGKVEIILRVLADHEGLTDCAAKFIKAGCESFKLFDVFKSVDLTAASVVSVVPPGAPLDFSPLRTPANEQEETLLVIATNATKAALAATAFVTAAFAGRRALSGLIDLTPTFLA